MGGRNRIVMVLAGGFAIINNRRLGLLVVKSFEMRTRSAGGQLRLTGPLDLLRSRGRQKHLRHTVQLGGPKSRATCN